MDEVANKTNDRLGASLTRASKIASHGKSKRKGFTPASASRIRKAYLKEMKFPPTRNMRISEDAILLAKTAWPQCNDRVRECSSAIRSHALDVINSRANKGS